MRGVIPPGLEGEEVCLLLDRLEDAPASLLLLDYDGTLAPFRTNPARALPYPGVLPLIQGIWEGGRTRVAFVTGRSLEGILPLLGMNPLPEIWASYGREHRLADGTSQTIPPTPEQAKGLAEAERRFAGAGPPARLEKKPFSLAAHVRGLYAGSAKAALRALGESWREVAEAAGLELLAFDGGLELRAPGWTKRDAVRAILVEAPVCGPVAYLGDDETDEGAFQALGKRGLPILVRGKWRPTAARVWLRPPGELLRFLEAWKERAG